MEAPPVSVLPLLAGRIGAVCFSPCFLFSNCADPSLTAHLLGEELYKKLIEYLKKHLADLYEASKSHTDEALLQYYIREWGRYTNSANTIHHIFRYLCRHWVKREIDEGKKSVYDVYTLHLVQWREEFFAKVSSNVMDAVLKLVEKQRNGEAI